MNNKTKSKSKGNSGSDKYETTSINLRPDQKEKIKKRFDKPLSPLIRQKIDELLASGDEVKELKQKKHLKEERLNELKEKQQELESEIQKLDKMIEEAEKEDEVDKYFNQNKMMWMNKKTREPVPLDDLTKEEKEKPDIRWVKKQEENKEGDSD
ncbi:MAG: hypothetical protein ABEI78_01550 [Candidatus Nanohaloarchaea archaeon]